MARVRTLVVDDAVVVRRLVSAALADDPEIEVIGTAANGRIALAKLAQSGADAVILDIEMPELDGLRTLAEIRRLYPSLPVIMFSSHTERGAAATIEALALGASDYVTKPPALKDTPHGVEHVKLQLLPKLKALCIGERVAALAKRAARTGQVRLAVAAAPHAPAIIAIGASTGGPNALQTMLEQLPADLGVPLVIVQHMPALFTRLLAERLTAKCRIRVDEAADGAPVRPNRGLIAPGDFHMTVGDDGNSVRAWLNQGPPENSCRPSVDVLFESVAGLYGPRVLAVVLTGMGRDGLRGCECVRAAGGQVLVQDEDSSVVWGMPGFVANAGLASMVLPPQQLGAEVARRCQPGDRKVMQ